MFSKFLNQAAKHFFPFLFFTSTSTSFSLLWSLLPLTSPTRKRQQAAWPQHKAAHKPDPLTQWAYATNKGAGRSFLPPASFPWTGKLRPEKIGPTRRVPEGIPLPDYARSSIPFSEQESRQQHSVPIRTEKEIAKARAACRIGREVLDEAARAVRPGVTTDEIDRVVHEATVERGAYPSPLNYYSFPKSVCTSVNEVVCHGIPDARCVCGRDERER